MPKTKRKELILDLHGVRHENVEKLIDKFIYANRDTSGYIKIITGNSFQMKKIVLDLLNVYSFDKIQIGDIINTGYIKIYL